MVVAANAGRAFSPCGDITTLMVRQEGLVSFHNFLHLSPFPGMMTGPAYLKFFGYCMKKSQRKPRLDPDKMDDLGDAAMVEPTDPCAYDVFCRRGRADPSSTTSSDHR